MNSASHTQIQSTDAVRRWIGWAAVIGGIFAVVELPLYFAVPACPVDECGVDTGALMPDWLILTRTLLSFFALVSLLVFMSGVRFLIAPRAPQLEWFAVVAGTTGAAWTIVDLVAKGLEGGSAILADEWIDPTRSVPTYLLYGAITHLLLLVFNVAFGYAVLRSGALPRWVAWSSFAFAALHVAGVPSMFLGHNSYDFYAANGWGAVATFNGISVIWLAIVGIAVLRTRRP